MLSNLSLAHVGPAQSMEMAFGSRVNLFTGDNGLGKSFLLDIIWWCLTQTWPIEVNPKLTCGAVAKPSGQENRIAFSQQGMQGEVSTVQTSFLWRQQAWPVTNPIDAPPALCLYAMADGSIATYDRNINNSHFGAIPAFVFSPPEVWDGLLSPQNTWLCNGLVRDWASWQGENGPIFRTLCEVIHALSPGVYEALQPGPLQRISLTDARAIPSLRMPHGEDVPILYASSGLKRILSLAYMLVWAWEEHKRVCALIKEPPTQTITLLIDEVEAHLHPQWQRRIVPALMKVVPLLAPEVRVQMFLVTHSPLVMASLEPIFTADEDAWFDLDFHHTAASPDKPVVALEKRPFVRMGDAANWLMSPAFDLKSARSVEAERALEDAALAMSEPNFDAAAAQALRTRLRSVLGELDPFWARFNFVAAQKGWWS